MGMNGWGSRIHFLRFGAGLDLRTLVPRVNVAFAMLVRCKKYGGLKPQILLIVFEHECLLGLQIRIALRNALAIIECPV